MPNDEQRCPICHEPVPGDMRDFEDHIQACRDNLR